MDKVSERSDCPIATSLEMLGDKWTLVIARDMLNGKSRFNEFMNSPERITATVLTKRLDAMVKHGIARRQLYQSNPARYQYVLTDRGVALAPVLLALCAWSNAQFPHTWATPEGFGVQKPLNNYENQE